MLKNIARFFMWITLCFFTFVVVYLGVFYLLSILPAGGQKEKGIGIDIDREEEITIYLSTNGVHTDFVLPVVSTQMDWHTKVALPANQIHWVAFGWGDKGFYLDTPAWSDLSVSTALRAISGTGGSAMHVTAYKAFVQDATSIELKLSTKEYQSLISYIDASFQKKDEQYQRIEVEGYHQSDTFYEARGSYSLFYTCNTWVNQGLKQMNQKAALWTLHDQGIFRHYK
ncbi:TIGR02117 family protein [Myroides odoratus]|uniref:TIGR02117 family protein n=1 Tax=Myroides odoratus TaxID=256 RepID=UPI0039B07047